MDGMFAFKLAVFLFFETTGGVALFLHRRVVAALALGALKNNQFTHFYT